MDKVELIFKVLAGSGSDVEIREVEEWKNRSMKNAREFEALKMFWQNSDDSPEDIYTEDLKAIKKSIESENRKRKRVRIVQWILFSAGLIALAVYLSLKQNRNNTNVLAYNVAPITEVVSDMENSYHIKVDVSPALQQCVFSGRLSYTSAQSSLLWLSANFNWKVTKINDSHYRLSGEGCGQAKNVKSKTD